MVINRLLISKSVFDYYEYNTTKNSVISPNFLVWEFCGKGQFPHSFGIYVYCTIRSHCNYYNTLQIVRELGESVETVRFVNRTLHGTYGYSHFKKQK